MTNTILSMQNNYFDTVHAFPSFSAAPKMAISCSPFFSFLILTGLVITISLPFSNSQPQKPPNIAGVCNGILVSYIYNSGFQIPPIYLPSEAAQQPYRFQSTLFLQNNVLEELKSWQVFVRFQYGEFLASVDRHVVVVEQLDWFTATS